MHYTATLNTRWQGHSRLRKALILGLIALSASVLPAAGSLLPGGAGNVFGAEAEAACKWDGKPGPGSLTNYHDAIWGWAKVVTGWCYDGVHVTSRHSERHAQIDGWGFYHGWSRVETKWTHSACYQYRGIYNHNCLTHAEVFAVGNKQYDIVCIHTRIYGNGAHTRRITSGNCP